MTPQPRTTQPVPRRRRKPVARLAVLLGAALALGPVPAALADSPEGEVTDLGVAMQSPNVRLSDVGTLTDGTPIAYLFSDGEPVTLNVVDLRTGELLDSHDMSPYSVASSIDVAADGTAYLSVRAPNDGSLWRYDPYTLELTKIASRIGDEEMLRTLNIHGDTLYGTTFPTAQVYAVDLGTDEITEFGSVTDRGDYGWGLHADSDRVLVGAGTPAQLYSLDPTNGDLTDIPLPDDIVADGGFIQRIETYGDLTAFSHRITGGGTLSLHDGTDWVGRLPVGGMWLYTEQTDSGDFYYLDADDQPYAFDIAGRTSNPIDLTGTSIEGETGSTTRVFLSELGTDEFPGATLIGTRTDGKVWRYNLETGSNDVLETAPFGSPVTIMSIAEGGDGQVYVGAYLSPGVMARIDPSTGTIEQLDGPEQADSIIVHGTRTVIATYPEAEFYAAEAGEEWVWDENPSHLFTLGRNATGQDRPRHMTIAGDLVAAGTIPNYGEHGGALTVFDPVTGEYEVHRNVVENQSVTDLAYLDGIVYGGTSIHGGLDTTPIHDTAELFAWDVEAQELITHAPIIDGAKVIHSLATDDAGRLWGMADNGVLFEYDPEAQEVAHRVESGITHGNTWGARSGLQFNTVDQMMYGHAGDQLFRFDPDHPELEILRSSGVRRAVIAAGDIYFTNDTNVFRYALAAPAAIEVTALPVNFTDEAGTADDSFTIPDVAGVAYTVDGTPLEAGTYPGSGEVTVVASALEGYVLAEDSTVEWSHAFSDAGDPGQSPEPTDPAPNPEPTQTPGDESSEPAPGPTGTTPGEGADPLPDTGASVGGLIAVAMALIGGATMLLIFRRLHLSRS